MLLFSCAIVLTQWNTARDGAAFRVAVAALMVGLWLGLIGLATFPQLHRLLHADSSASSHDCLITQLAKCQFLAAGGTIAIAVAAVEFFKLPTLPERLKLPTADWRITSPRGPPVHSFLP